MASLKVVPRIRNSGMRNSRRAWCCLVVWVVVILVSIDVSTATWSPHQYPTQHQHQHTTSAFKEQGADQLRGGSTKLQPLPPPPPPSLLSSSSQREYHQEQPPQELELVRHQQQHPSSPPQQYHDEEEMQKPLVPKISLKQVAKALVHTSEWNRRLQQGVKHWGRHRNRILSSHSHYYIEHGKHQHRHHPQHSNTNSNVHDAQKNVYGNIPVNVHPSRTWHPPIQASSGRFLEEEELSLFHAKSGPRSEEQQSAEDEYEDTTNKGVDHWGPDLLPYLEHIVDLLGIDKNGIEICLAMIYLDRACTVERPRSNGVPSCPFCSPRTVHRLSLAALLVSMEAVRGEPHQHHPEGDYLARLSQSLGIPLFQLQQMVDWMRGALGDEGLYVTLEEMKKWSRSWESIFSA